MTRVKNSVTTRARHKKVLKAAKGYFGSKHRLYKTAQEQLFHSGAYSYQDRKKRANNFRKLWITRINAACRENEISYSRFIEGLNKAGVEVNRKMLSEIAIENPKAFTELVNTAKKGLEGKTVAAKKEAKVEVEVIKETVKKETKKEEVKEEKAEKKTVKKAAVKEEKVEKVEEKKAPAKKTTEKKPAAPKKTTKKETK